MQVTVHLHATLMVEYDLVRGYIKYSHIVPHLNNVIYHYHRKDVAGELHRE